MVYEGVYNNEIKTAKKKICRVWGLTNLLLFILSISTRCLDELYQVLDLYGDIFFAHIE